MKYYKDINNIVNDMLTIGNETKKREKELMQEEKRCSFRVVIVISDLPNQSEKDMEYNAEQYIKDDIEMNNLYIEDIIKLEEE
tara:strand:+ start:83 stop:331 length:249 start_codon:yes stop_codon:yes gene_type:complete